MNDNNHRSHSHFKLFFRHILLNFSLAIFLVAVALFVGMMGYHRFEKMSWIDSFVNAAMILSGMGPFNPLTSTAAKIFAGLYALFSGLVFIALMGLMLAPVFAYIVHRIHLDKI